MPGRALYEVKVTPRARQIDFLVLAESTAAFAVQLKGGLYSIQDGELCLNTGDGIIPKPGLLASVWDSAMAVPQFIERNLHRGMYIIPVLALPDMEQDEDILGMAARRNVEVLFGTWTTGSTAWSAWPAITPSGTGPPSRPSSRRC